MHSITPTTKDYPIQSVKGVKFENPCIRTLTVTGWNPRSEMTSLEIGDGTWIPRGSVQIPIPHKSLWFDIGQTSKPLAPNFLICKMKLMIKIYPTELFREEVKLYIKMS